MTAKETLREIVGDIIETRGACNYEALRPWLASYSDFEWAFQEVTQDEWLDIARDELRKDRDND